MARVRYLRRILLLAAIAALAVAAFMCFVGWQHNSQGEFYDSATGAVDLTYLARVFVSWYLLVFLGCSVLGSPPAP